MANNLGTTSGSWGRQVEAGASGVPQDRGMKEDLCTEGLEPLGELGKRRIYDGIQKGAANQIQPDQEG